MLELYHAAAELLDAVEAVDRAAEAYGTHEEAHLTGALPPLRGSDRDECLQPFLAADAAAHSRRLAAMTRVRLALQRYAWQPGVPTIGPRAS